MFRAAQLFLASGAILSFCCATQSSVPPPAEIATLRATGLTAHNKYRSLHGVPPLIADGALDAHAQHYAEHLAQIDAAVEPHELPYGENIFWSNQPLSNTGAFAGNAATDIWYSEIKIYDFQNVKATHEIGHFTQLIWRDSRMVGFGMATSATGKTYVVAEYSPKGNIVYPTPEETAAYFAKMVPPPVRPG